MVRIKRELCEIIPFMALEGRTGQYGLVEIRIGNLRRFAMYIADETQDALEILDCEREQAESTCAFLCENELSPCHLREWLEDQRALAREQE